MDTDVQLQDSVQQVALVNYLISMARTVEGSVRKSIEALLDTDASLAGGVFLLEPRVNEMELVIDDHAVRQLQQADLSADHIRLIVATLRINNDLERIGDLAVNICERVVSLAQMPAAERPPELAPMSEAVQLMVRKSLGALIYRNIGLAHAVLQSDDLVDRYRDQIFERLLAEISKQPGLAAPGMHYVLASRYLERIADHSTNIAEDILYWLRGMDVRHNRTRMNPAPPASWPYGA